MLETIRRGATPAYGTREALSTAGLLQVCDWLEFFEAVEYIAKGMLKRSGTAGFSAFTQEVNEVFADEGVAYTITNTGDIVLRVTTEYVQAGSDAMSMLDRDDLEVYGRQLTDAYDKLKLRKLDPTSAVAAAVGALEGVVRVALGVDSGNISANRTRLRELLHPTLVNALVNLEAYRGDIAARHEANRGDVSQEEAIAVLHMCSAAITLVRQRAPKGR